MTCAGLGSLDMTGLYLAQAGVATAVAVIGIVPGCGFEQRLCQQLAKPTVVLLLAALPSIVSHSCHCQSLEQS